jgi:hypothetical protein
VSWARQGRPSCLRSCQTAVVRTGCCRTSLVPRADADEPAHRLKGPTPSHCLRRTQASPTPGQPGCLGRLSDGSLIGVDFSYGRPADWTFRERTFEAWICEAQISQEMIFRRRKFETTNLRHW